MARAGLSAHPFQLAHRKGRSHLDSDRWLITTDSLYVPGPTRITSPEERRSRPTESCCMCRLGRDVLFELVLLTVHTVMANAFAPPASRMSTAA